MKVNFEKIKMDGQSSFCTLHFDYPVREHRWAYHYHPEIELVCVVAGRGARHVGYHKGSYYNGDLVLIGANLPHSGFGLNSTDPHEEIVLQFREEIIQLPGDIPELSPLKKMLALAKFGIMFSEETKEKTIPKLRHLVDALHPKRYLLLLSILVDLAEENNYTLLNKEVMPHTAISRHKDRLQMIFTYVEKNYHREIDIKEISDSVNLTLPSFCNFFKKTMKMTFTDFLNQYRIDKACQLLLQGKNISESCYSTGYNNISYFNRAFKKYVGKTPTEFNRELIK